MNYFKILCDGINLVLVWLHLIIYKLFWNLLFMNKKRNNDRKLLSIYERYWNRNKAIIYSNNLESSEKMAVPAKLSTQTASSSTNFLSQFQNMLQPIMSKLGLQ